MDVMFVRFASVLMMHVARISIGCCWCVFQETLQWCRTIVRNSPTAIACLKAALNADEDGQAGVMQLAGNATRLFYLSEEGKEGRNAFLEKRKPEFRKLLSSKLWQLWHFCQVVASCCIIRRNRSMLWCDTILVTFVACCASLSWPRID